MSPEPLRHSPINARAFALLAAFVILLALLAPGPAIVTRVINPGNAHQVTQQAVLMRGTAKKLIWSPDGQTLAVAGSMGVWLYDTHQFEADPRLLDGQTGRVQEAIFSPDGTQLISADVTSVRTWDVYTGRQVGSISFDGKKILSPRFSVDASTVLLGVEDEPTALWDIATGKQLATYHFSFNHVEPEQVVFTPDLTRLAYPVNRRDFSISRVTTRSIRVWDILASAQVADIPMEDTNLLAISLAFSSDGTLLAVQTMPADFEYSYFSKEVTHQIYVWEIASGRLLNILDNTFEPFYGYSSSNYSLAPRLTFSADQRYLSVNWTTSHLWDIATGEEQPLPPTEPPPLFLQFRSWKTLTASTPDGRTAAAVVDGVLQIWDVPTEELLHSAGLFSAGRLTNNCVSANYTADGSTLILRDLSTAIYPWDVATGAPLPPVSNDNMIATVHPNLKLLAIPNSEHKRVTLYDIASHTSTQIGVDPCPFAGPLAFSPDEDRLAIVTCPPRENRTVILWDIAANQQLAAIDLGKFGPYWLTFISKTTLMAVDTARAFILVNVDTQQLLEFPAANAVASSDGAQILTLDSDANTLQVWDAATGRQRYAIITDPVTKRGFTPDGTHVIFFATDPVSGKSRVNFWDLSTNQVKTILERPQPPLAFALNPAGDILALAAPDGLISLWDTRTGAELAELPGRGILTGLEFSPDGLILISVTSDGDVRRWGVPAH